MQPTITISLKLSDHLTVSVVGAGSEMDVTIVSSAGRYGKEIVLDAKQFDRLADFVARARTHLAQDPYDHREEEGA